MGKLSPVIIWFSLAASLVLFMDVFMFWIPVYRLNSLIRCCAAVVSILAVYKLLKYIPALLTLKPADNTSSTSNKVTELETELQKNMLQSTEDQQKITNANEIIKELQALMQQESATYKKEYAELQTAYENIELVNQGLEKKLAERTMQLEAMNREYDAFSYAVSHDMKAPLRIINGYTEILYSDYQDVMDAECKRLLQIVLTNTGQMSNMIDALLTIARIGRKELMILHTDMESVIKSSISEQVTATSSKATFNVGNISPVHCDSVLIRSVWNNLITNAIKYSETSEQPVIHIGSEKKDGKIVYFIKDNGIGFDMQYVHKLFGVFQRLHKTDTPRGAGTGLALVQRIILKHGGYVWAEGAENSGATFYFSLPDIDNKN